MFPSSLWVKSSWSVTVLPPHPAGSAAEVFCLEASQKAPNLPGIAKVVLLQHPARLDPKGPSSEVFLTVKVGKTLNITELKWENHGQLWKIKDNLVLSSIFQRFPKDNHCFTQRNVTACLSKSIFSSWGPISNGLMDIRYIMKNMA